MNPGDIVYTPKQMYGSSIVGTATIITTSAIHSNIRMRGKLSTFVASNSHLFTNRTEAAEYWERLLSE